MVAAKTSSEIRHGSMKQGVQLPFRSLGMSANRADPNFPVERAIAVARSPKLRRMLVLSGPCPFADLGLHDLVQGPEQELLDQIVGCASRLGRAAPGRRRSDNWVSMVSDSS